jgi:hypothetical protein
VTHTALMRVTAVEIVISRSQYNSEAGER